MMSAKGWAILYGGKILINTVSPSRRGAIVNFLVGEGVMVLARHTDSQIENAWKSLLGTPAGTAEVIEVDVMRRA